MAHQEQLMDDTQDSPSRPTRRWSPEQREAARLRGIERWKDPDFRERMRLKQNAPEAVAKMRAANKGKPKTPETIAKIVAKTRGRKVPRIPCSHCGRLIAKPHIARHERACKATCKAEEVANERGRKLVEELGLAKKLGLQLDVGKLPSAANGGTGYIYYLFDPRVGEPRYVGWTIDPRDRLRRHIKDSKTETRTYRNFWIRKLLREGVSPMMMILEVNPLDYGEAERSWIQKLRAEGCRLTNRTDGGDGAPGYRHTEETKRRLATMNVGRPLTAEHRAAISAGLKGRIKSPEERANISKGLKGKRKSPAHRAALKIAQGRPERIAALVARNQTTKMRAVTAAKNRTDEHRAAVAAGWARQTAETKARISAEISARSKGKPKSTAHRAALSAAKRGVPVGPSKEVVCELCGKAIRARGLPSHQSGPNCVR